MKRLLLLVAFGACKGNSASKPPPPPSTAVSDGAVALPPAPIDAAVAAPAVLDYESEPEDLEKLVFAGKVPVLPALSLDGESIADFASDATGMMIPAPSYLAIRRVDNTGTVERLEIVDDQMATAAQDKAWDPAPPEPVAKVLKERGAAIAKRLAGFSSLLRVEVPVTSNGDPKPATIGAYTFTAVEPSDESRDRLMLKLADATGRTVRTEVIDSYASDERPASFAGGACSYRPTFDRAGLDRAKTTLYTIVMFRWNDECTPQPPHYVVWKFPSADETTMATLVAEQLDPSASFEKLFTPDAQLVNGTDVTDPTRQPFLIKASNEEYTGHEDDNFQVVLSRDGKSAWASLTSALSILLRNEPGRDDPWRVSSVLVKTPTGWKIAATTWTEPRANAKANADAKNGKLAFPAPFTAPAGDPSLAAAFAKLVSDGIDPASEARSDLVALGSGPGERTVGGRALARGWNAGWKGKATITSSIAKLAPSGTTGWVAAAVSLSKGSYKIPFDVFAVFDKDAGGAWTLVHIHFSV